MADDVDVGTLAGIAPVGVRASRDEAAVLDGDADCVVYAAPAGSRPKEALADLCRILAAGKNVVTMSLPGLVYERGSLSERYLDAIRQAAHAGSSSIFSSGVEPGFGCDLFPIALVTGTSRGVGVGIAHELLRAGATVIGCSRSQLDALPGTDAEPDWARRSAQMTCDQGDYHTIDALVSQVAATYGGIGILVNNAGGTVPTPNVEDVPVIVQQIQGAPGSDDDYERTVLFHSFAIQMNLISPLSFAIRVYRQMRSGAADFINGTTIEIDGGMLPGVLLRSRRHLGGRAVPLRGP